MIGETGGHGGIAYENAVTFQLIFLSMGLQRVRQDWATKLNWKPLQKINPTNLQKKYFS